KVAELARAEFGSTAISRDAYLGDILRPEAAPPVAAADERPASHERRTAPRSAKLRRRPRVRPPGDGEDEAQSSVWMVQTSEPLEHAEDPMGLQRPTDRDEGADPSGLADSLAELPEARLVRTAQPAKEVLLSD